MENKNEKLSKNLKLLNKYLFLSKILGISDEELNIKFNTNNFLLNDLILISKETFISIDYLTSNVITNKNIKLKSIKQNYIRDEYIKKKENSKVPNIARTRILMCIFIVIIAILIFCLIGEKNNWWSNEESNETTYSYAHSGKLFNENELVIESYQGTSVYDATYIDYKIKTGDAHITILGSSLLQVSTTAALNYLSFNVQLYYNGKVIEEVPFLYSNTTEHSFYADILKNTFKNNTKLTKASQLKITNIEYKYTY